MAPIDWGTLLAIAPQLATAIAFGYFVLKLLERQDKQNEKRDMEWREYLALGRDQYIESVNEMANEIKSLATTIVTTHAAVIQLENWSHSESIRVDAVRTASAAAVAAEVVRAASQVAAQQAEVARVLKKEQGG